MEDTEAFSIAKNLFESKSVVQRPPSGSRGASRNFPNAYVRELSNTTLKTAKFLSNHPTPPSALKGDKPQGIRPQGGKRRVQSAVSRLTSTPNRDQNFSRLHHERNTASVVPSLELDRNQSECVDDDSLKPSVLGLKHHRQVWGSEPDITKLDRTTVDFPYRLDSASTKHNRSKKSEYQDTTNLLNACTRSMAKSLKPLSPWLTENIPESFLGIDPKKCLVFLPGLPVDYENLPVVPPMHTPEEDLPNKGKIEEPEVWKPKKYKHYHSKTSVDQWICKHGSREVKIYKEDGQLLHVRHQGRRTAEVVRKEIKELEDLMKGVGTDGGCVVVQYQADISRLQEMVDDTLARVVNRDISETPEPNDYCGLRRFYKEHEEVMTQIKNQHALCLQELAEIEREMGLDSDRKYFTKQETKEINITLPTESNKK